jgi:Phosphatidylethanolamine-binding protein
MRGLRLAYRTQGLPRPVRQNRVGRGIERRLARSPFRLPAALRPAVRRSGRRSARSPPAEPLDEIFRGCDTPITVHFACLGAGEARRGQNPRPRASIKRATISATLGITAPCPPKGHGTHHYHIRLLTVSRPTLDFKAPASALDVRKATEPYVCDRAHRTGGHVPPLATWEDPAAGQ